MPGGAPYPPYVGARQCVPRLRIFTGCHGRKAPDTRALWHKLDSCTMAKATKNACPPITIPGNAGVKVMKTCTIRASAAELYHFWRNFANLSRIIRHPVKITVLSETESEWSVSAPFTDKKVSWRATVIDDTPPRVIAWCSNPNSEVTNTGTVCFEKAPGDEGTEVTVSIEYDPPGGKLVGMLAKLSPDAPSRQVADSLRRLKALFEAGEIPTIEGQSVGEPQRSKRK